MSGLQKNPPIERYVDLYQKNLTEFPKLNDQYEQKMAAYEVALKQWQTPEHVKAYNTYINKLREAQKNHLPNPVMDFPAKPKELPIPGGDQKGPANNFNGMIAPLIPYAIKGVIWYQGEYNTDDPAEYFALFSRLIDDWREKWASAAGSLEKSSASLASPAAATQPAGRGAGDFPFLFVQLPALWLKGWERSIQSDNWDVLREGQLKTLSVPHTGMAVAMDVGGGLHPSGKLYVGQRWR